MLLNKNYKLLRFLNSSHGSFLCNFFGFLAWLVCFVLAQSRVLAQMSRQDFLSGDFKIAFRRSAWFVRKKWQSVDLVKDKYFDFTVNSTPLELAAIEAFIEDQKPSNADLEYLTDKVYLRANQLHLMIEEFVPYLEIKAAAEDFYTSANLALVAIDWSQPAQPVSTVDRKADFSKLDAVQALQDFATLLPIEVWPWYTISGTFLGLYREGGFLEHDYDIDVGINAEGLDLDRLLAILADSKVFVVKKLDHHIVVDHKVGVAYSMTQTPALIKLIHKNGLNIDLFIHHLESGKRWHGSILHRWENTPFETERRVLEGVVVNAPTNADLYLTENYGNWRTPVKQFDCSTGTPNLVVSKSFKSMALFIKRLALQSIDNPPEALKLKNALLVAGLLKQTDGGLTIERMI